MSKRVATCDFCGSTFESTWTQEEADQECRENFGVEPQADDLVSCDECYEVVRRGPGDPEAEALAASVHYGLTKEPKV